jgi:hypothetical protein
MTTILIISQIPENGNTNRLQPIPSLHHRIKKSPLHRRREPFSDIIEVLNFTVIPISQQPNELNKSNQ